MPSTDCATFAHITDDEDGFLDLKATFGNKTSHKTISFFWFWKHSTLLFADFLSNNFKKTYEIDLSPDNLKNQCLLISNLVDIHREDSTLTIKELLHENII